MSIEKREQERFSLNLQAKIHSRHAQDETSIVDTVAANISRGGAFLATEHPFPMASKVEIEFLLELEALKQLRFIISMEGLKQLSKGAIWVKITVVVIRKTEAGIGVIFDKDPQLTPLHTTESRD